MHSHYESGIKSAVFVRWFGWSMLFLIATYLINNWFEVEKDWVGLGALFNAELNSQVITQLCIYGGGFLIALLYVLSTRRRTLRADAERVSNFNAYLIRTCFWGVLFIGLADMAISFLRVEGLLGQVVGEDLLKKLGRPKFRGEYVHMPLLAAGALLALVTRTLGFHWLAILIVTAELMIVFTRFVFSYEQAFMGDLVRFWYAALFLFASAYTLLEDGHVRVDVFYAGLSRRSRGAVNSFGAMILGITLCWVIIVIGFKGRASIIYGPIVNFEVSQSGFGMYTKYLMAAFLGVFAITMLIQFISQFFESYADLRDDPGGRAIEDDVASTH